MKQRENTVPGSVSKKGIKQTKFIVRFGSPYDYYNPQLPMIVSADGSSFGVGVVKFIMSP